MHRGYRGLSEDIVTIGESIRLLLTQAFAAVAANAVLAMAEDRGVAVFLLGGDRPAANPFTTFVHTEPNAYFSNHSARIDGGCKHFKRGADAAPPGSRFRSRSTAISTTGATAQQACRKYDQAVHGRF
jgi:hypothetical protein